MARAQKQEQEQEKEEVEQDNFHEQEFHEMEGKKDSHSAAIELKKLFSAESFKMYGFAYHPVVLCLESRFRSETGEQSRYMVLEKYGADWYRVNDALVTKVSHMVEEAVVMVWAVRGESEIPEFDA